jgi:putative hemolysin
VRLGFVCREREENLLGSSFEIILIVLLTLLNSVFSMSETAIVSARRTRLQQRVNLGDTRAKTALELAQHPDRFLSTVQIGITLIGILAGAFGGARLSEDLARVLEGMGLSANVSKNVGFGLVVVAITYLSLVIGELVPKRLALNNPEGIASLVAAPMNTLSRLTAPLVSLLTVSSNAVLWLLRVKPSSEPVVTEDEIKILIAQATHAGVFAEEEQEIVERVFRTADRRVQDLMTPRKEIVWLDKEESKETIRQQLLASHRSRFPVGEGSLDQVVGVASLKDLWEAMCTDAEIPWPQILREPLYIYESTRALEVLDKFRAAGQHMALVVDEYGVVAGLVTLHDVMEAMVGEVPTVEEPQDAAVVQREDGSWLLDGMLPKAELMRLLGLRDLPEAEEYSTLGGFVMERLGRIPAVSDHFEYGGLRFEVMDMDGHRVDKVLVAPRASLSETDRPT